MKPAYLLSTAALTALVLVAAQPLPDILTDCPIPDPARCYLPLERGNVWRYVSTDGPVHLVKEVRIEKSAAAHGREIFYVDDLFFDVADGPVGFTERDDCLYEYRDGQLHALLPWCTQKPFTLPPIADDCLHGATALFAQVGPIVVPAGRFAQPLAVRYTDLPCVCAGPSRDVFVRGVGLVQRTVLSIAGARTWSLYYAKVNGRIYGDPDYTTPWQPAFGTRIPIPHERTTWSGIKERYR